MSLKAQEGILIFSHSGNKLVMEKRSQTVPCNPGKGEFSAGWGRILERVLGVGSNAVFAVRNFMRDETQLVSVIRTVTEEYGDKLLYIDEIEQMDFWAKDKSMWAMSQFFKDQYVESIWYVFRMRGDIIGSDKVKLWVDLVDLVMQGSAVSKNYLEIANVLEISKRIPPCKPNPLI